MACLLVASKSFCDGDEIAAEVASSLGCSLLGEELLRETAERYSASEQHLLRAVTAPPSMFGMPAARRTRCLAYLTAVLIEHIARGQLVYCGPGAHLLVPALPHVIRVEVSGEDRQRAARMAQAQGGSPDAAAKEIASRDRELEHCAELVFGIRGDDESRCELEVDLDRDGRAGAVAAILEAAASPRFQPTSYSAHCVADALLSARARAILVSRDTQVQVSADGGELAVRLHLKPVGQQRALAAIREELSELPGLQQLKIDPLSESAHDRRSR